MDSLEEKIKLLSQDILTLKDEIYKIKRNTEGMIKYHRIQIEALLTKTGLNWIDEYNCNQCDGKGYIPSYMDDMNLTCKKCKGGGKVYV